MREFMPKCRLNFYEYVMKKKLIFSVGVILLIASYYFFKEDREPFDQEVWLTSKHCKPIKEASKRSAMIEDLTTNVLTNKSADEIKALLGEPEDENVLPNIKRDFIYCIGKSHGLTMKWLVIHLKEGRFDRHDIFAAD